MVSSNLGDKWHSDTKAVEGSGGMTECITEKDGSVGYLESGHGWSESLQEVSLQNKEGYFTTSKKAFKEGGIASAAVDPVLPAHAWDDWGNVEFINMVRERYLNFRFMYRRTTINIDDLIQRNRVERKHFQLY